MSITADDIRDYAGSISHTDEEIDSAIVAEIAAQARRCYIPVVVPADLLEALKRRVVRNLAMRGVILPTDMMGDASSGNSGYVPFNDPEIRRLEAPHRKVFFA